MPRLKVAIVHYRDDFRTGGSLRVGETLANHLNAGEVQAELIFAYGVAGPVSKSSRVPCHFIEANGPFDFFAWRRFRTFIRSSGFDIVHNVDGVGWMQLATVGLDVVSLLHVHDRLIPDYLKAKHKLTNRLISSATDARIFISNGAKNNYLTAGLGRAETSHVVYNSIDCDRFVSKQISQTDCRKRLGLPTDVRLIGMVCRLTEAKGCLDLLRVLTRLPDSWHAAFTNDGPLRETLMEFTRIHGLGSRVHMLGVQTEITTVYGSLDVLGFFTRYEAFGLTMAEAMALGIPVFGLSGAGEYREPAFPLITADNALLIERAKPDDFFAPEQPTVLDELAARIKDFGDHPEKYREMIACAREWIHTHFCAGRQANDVVKVYQNLLAQRRWTKAGGANQRELKNHAI